MQRARIQEITIEIPTVDAEPWITIILLRETVDEQGNTIQEEPFWHRIYRRQSDFVTEAHEIFDAVLWQRTSISGAGMATAIQALAYHWAVTDLGGRWQDGYVVLDASS